MKIRTLYLAAMLLAPLMAIAAPSARSQTIHGGGGAIPSAACGNSGNAVGWNGSAWYCQAITGGSAGAGGSNTQVQYNQGGAIQGISGQTTDGTNSIFANNTFRLTGLTSGTTIVKAPATGGGTATFFAGTDTIVGAAAAQTLTNKSIVATQLTGTLQATQFPALTGDITTVAGLLGTTLATVNSTVGTYGDASHCPSFTVNSKGLITNASQSTSCPGGSGGGGTPGGSTTQLQYNNAGSFGGVTGATTNGTVMTLTSPVLVTPVLGTIASGNLAAGTGYTIANVAGLGTGVATAAAIAADASGGFCTNSATSACALPGSQLSHNTSFTINAAQFANQDPVLATGTLTETFPATSTLSANGFQFLQNSGTSTLTIQPNAADQVCPSGAACGTAGVAYALAANYSALIQTDAASHLYVTPIPPAGGTATAGGSNTQCQYNNSTALGGTSGCTSNGTATTFSSGNFKLSGASSGTTILNAPATGGGTATLFAGTDTVAGLGTAQTFSATQTFTSVKTTSRTVSGTTDTLVATDCGTVVIFTSGSAVTVTIPASIVPAANTICNIAIKQAGAGQVSVNGSAVTAATLVSAHSYTKTFGQYSLLGLTLTTESAVTTATVSGDGA